MALTRKDFLKTTAIVSFAGIPLNAAGCDTKTEDKFSEKIKPVALKRGDTLGLVAPASPIYEDSVFQKMLDDLQGLGFKLKLGNHVRSQRGYLAGTDEDRAGDLMAMFKDPDVDGIMCIRGGWGCNRILPLLNYEVIRNNPKVFCGFSDITSLHMAMYKKSDLITFHGPVGKSDWNDFTTNAFKKIIWEGKETRFGVHNDSDDSFSIHPGVAKGILFGGNLSVLVSMIGSDYLPSFENAILFLEDIGESVYRIDRMITQLKLAGILDQINGFVFGKCSDCSAGENSLTLKEVFDDHIKPLNIPAFYGASISHEEYNITLPQGISGEINATLKTIDILESAVIK
ncbi:MAG: LD-carboxypeptidase [Gracilimonas sp.]